MIHSYLEHMKRMVKIAEDVSGILNHHHGVQRSPRAAKIINAISRTRGVKKKKNFFPFC